jgi:hypothetical protein
MRRVHASITLAAAAALALGGCAATPPNSAKDFKGAEADVAAVVDDLQTAGRKGDPDKICNDVFTKELAASFKAGTSTCVDEVEKVLRDVNDYDLQVQDVTVTGTTATAKVRQGKEGRTATFAFERVGNGWRASKLS